MPSDHEKVDFTADEIKAVRAAIRRARQDMIEWEKASRVDPEKMRIPMTPPSVMRGSHLESACVAALSTEEVERNND